MGGDTPHGEGCCGRGHHASLWQFSDSVSHQIHTTSHLLTPRPQTPPPHAPRQLVVSPSYKLELVQRYTNGLQHGLARETDREKQTVMVSTNSLTCIHSYTHHLGHAPTHLDDDLVVLDPQ